MVTGFCRTCKKKIELKDVEIKSMKTQPMDYYLGHCPHCNRRFSVIKGRNNIDIYSKFKLKVFSKIEETKMGEFWNCPDWEQQKYLDKFLTSFKNCIREKIKKDL